MGLIEDLGTQQRALIVWQIQVALQRIETCKGTRFLEQQFGTTVSVPVTHEVLDHEWHDQNRRWKRVHAGHAHRNHPSK